MSANITPYDPSFERQLNMDAVRALYNSVLELIESKVVESRHAVHPSGRFCTVCGRNSAEAVHVDGCPIARAEAAIEYARRLS